MTNIIFNIKTQSLQPKQQNVLLRISYEKKNLKMVYHLCKLNRGANTTFDVKKNACSFGKRIKA